MEAHPTRNCAWLANDPEKCEAYAMSKAFFENGKIIDRGRDRFALFITGGFGTGKTWLGSALFMALLHSGKNGIWRKFYAFVREVQSCYSHGATENSDAVISRYQRTPLLMIDDIGDLNKGTETEDRARILYEVLDYRNDHLLPTIITSNLTPDELEHQFGERTFQRVMEMAAFVTMEGKNMREAA